MKKKHIVLFVAGLAILFGGMAVAITTSRPLTMPEALNAPNYKDTTYILDGQDVHLVDGKAEMDSAPGSASKLVTRYFGNEIETDLNGDDRPDKVFLLTQSGGGSGTFFYVVAALNTEHGYVGSHGYLLGDRIAPQTTVVSQDPAQKGVIIVNYADRAPGEPMTVQPSEGKSAYLKLDPSTMLWGIVEPNFEGEADLGRMMLDMKTWNWVGAQYRNNTSVTPKKAGAFTLTFLSAKKFSATTDCNSVAGNYAADAGTITFSDVVSTRMYCEGSQESDFTKVFGEATSYRFTSKGELVFDLNGGGTATFR